MFNSVPFIQLDIRTSKGQKSYLTGSTDPCIHLLHCSTTFSMSISRFRLEPRCVDRARNCNGPNHPCDHPITLFEVRGQQPMSEQKRVKISLVRLQLDISEERIATDYFCSRSQSIRLGSTLLRHISMIGNLHFSTRHLLRSIQLLVSSFKSRYAIDREPRFRAVRQRHPRCEPGWGEFSADYHCLETNIREQRIKATAFEDPEWDTT